MVPLSLPPLSFVVCRACARSSETRCDGRSSVKPPRPRPTRPDPTATAARDTDEQHRHTKDTREGETRVRREGTGTCGGACVRMVQADITVARRRLLLGVTLSLSPTALTHGLTLPHAPPCACPLQLHLYFTFPLPSTPPFSFPLRVRGAPTSAAPPPAAAAAVAAMSNSYMFEAQPRPVQSGTKTKTATRAKYRDPADTVSGGDTHRTAAG